ncbi:MAG: phosphatidate cytidylyltransferase [Alphaproteobacteria bacterium]
MLKQRIISALVMIPLPLLIVYLGNPWFALTGALLGVAMAWEWQQMLENKCDVYALFLAGSASISTLLSLVCPIAPFMVVFFASIIFFAIFNQDSTKLKIFGFFYISLPLVSLVWLRSNFDFAYVLWIIGVVLATDIGGYVFGCSIRGPLLLPSISPKKTWAGLIGGMLLAALTGFAYAKLAGKEEIWFAGVSAFLAVISQVGDFFESGVKRRLGKKDSSNLIPGHGGIFDRIDGLLFVAPAVAIFQGIKIIIT